MAHGETHSTIVAWLKILLPLAALGLLSTVFLLASDRDPGGDIPFAAEGLTGDGARERITAPYYAGTTAEGASVTLRAVTARPVADAPDQAEAEDITASILMQDGGQIDLTARRGLVSDADQMLTLLGDVVITTSQGYRLTTDRLETAIDAVSAHSPGPVQGTGPLGRLNAGRMELTTDPDTGAAQLLFTNGVKLLYTPQS